MNKTLLVALREYVDNLRTKTFWIGILSFPLILVVVMVVPVLLEKAKDVRRYAVVDRSGWLLEALEDRAAMPDVAKVFRSIINEYKEKGPENIENNFLPNESREALKYIATLDEEQIDQIIDQIEKLYGPEGFQFLEALPVEAREQLEQSKDYIREWWRNLPPEEAKKYGKDMSRSRYMRIEVGEDIEDPERFLNEKIQSGEIFAYFVVSEDPVEDDEGCKYVSNNLTDQGLKGWFTSIASDIVRAKRIAREGLSLERAKWIQEGLAFEGTRLTTTGTEAKVGLKDTTRQWAPVAFVYLLWISVFTAAQMLLTNTIEEKSNRLMEVLLSSVSPLQLMSGKIIGIAVTGLTVVVSWVIFFFITVKSLPYFVEKLPDIDLSFIISDPIYLGSFILYFLLGYLLYASVLVGIGSIFNSLKEAQNFMSTVVLLLMIPILAMIPIGKDPNGMLAKVLSYIPTFTPFVMMNRAAGPPAVAEYVVTGLVLVVTIVFSFILSAKVFRMGVLMTGKPPRIMEIFRMVKAK